MDCLLPSNTRVSRVSSWSETALCTVSERALACYFTRCTYTQANNHRMTLVSMLYALVFHQPYAMALSGSATGVFSVTLNVKSRASLQKNMNNSCQLRMRQKRTASISMSIGEECIVL